MIVDTVSTKLKKEVSGHNYKMISKVELTIDGLVMNVMYFLHIYKNGKLTSKGYMKEATAQAKYSNTTI